MLETALGSQHRPEAPGDDPGAREAPRPRERVGRGEQAGLRPSRR